MNGFSRGLTFVALALLASAARAQQVPEKTPASDPPNGQQKVEKTKKPAPKKVYTNADLVSPDAKQETAKKDDAANPASRGDDAKAASSSIPATPASGPLRSRVLDSPRQTLPEVIVVPAGTQIKVDISEDSPRRAVPLRMFSGKVTVPVRVAWVTAIPALTKVAVEVSAPYGLASGREQNVNDQEVAQLASVTLDGTRYELQTDQVPVLAGSEATFTLLKDVRLQH